MQNLQDHGQLVDRGTLLHEAKEYAGALLCFEQALQLAPLCPSALYNQANTLYMLGEYTAAIQLLEALVSSPPSSLQKACAVSAGSVRSLQLDAHYLLYLSTLQHSESWLEAYPYLQAHLALRERGLRSLFSKAQICAEASASRLRYESRAAQALFPNSIDFTFRPGVHPQLQDGLQSLGNWLSQWYSLPRSLEIRFFETKHLFAVDDEPVFLKFWQDEEGQKAITVEIAVGAFAENLETDGPECAYPTVVAAVGRGLKYGYQLAYDRTINKTNVSRWGDKFMAAYNADKTPPPPMERSWTAWHRAEEQRRPTR